MIKYTKIHADWDTAGIDVSANSLTKLDQLIKRDGMNCFYYNKIMIKSEITKEHLLAKVHGGNSNINNIVLACTKCNSEAGSLSLIEKINMKINNKDETS